MSQPEAWHVGRTMRMLELLAFEPLSAQQLAVALRSTPRTVRRVLARLEDDDYLTRSEGPPRQYRPTMRLVALAGQVVENSSLARRSRPYVALLHEQTGAAAHLLVPSYHSVLCLVHVATDDDARPRLRELVPAHCTAGGKALLAGRDRWRESVLAAPLERLTERTIVDADALRRELEAVQRDGYATEDGELQPQLRAAAAPLQLDGHVVGALSTSGRGLDVEAAAARVLAIAGRINEDLR